MRMNQPITKRPNQKTRMTPTWKQSNIPDATFSLILVPRAFSLPRPILAESFLRKLQASLLVLGSDGNVPKAGIDVWPGFHWLTQLLPGWNWPSFVWDLCHTPRRISTNSRQVRGYVANHRTSCHLPRSEPRCDAEDVSRGYSI